ncbi:hypothetical protein ALQ84_200322 [Pseudomonas caricapapayae]|uniref:Uncharacterized protein n=1 Tax=Pseudomonas caricapapayae TaxID=46678 RepID=A0A3M3AXD4_9PSED|nr:hypothetical protein ALQ84_200322 [Pseudomonas caricapapayae]RMV92497.1 hypothetical protein ALP01_200384 [Pseudomonas caricapapayae]
MNHVITVVYYFVFSVLLVGCSNGLTQASAPPRSIGWHRDLIF